jgi:hypothetical protein
MNKYLPTEWKRDTSDIIRDSLLTLAEAVTGILASDRKELAFSVGHIFQSLRKGRFLTQFATEWNQYRDKGKIDDTYTNTEQHFECLSELLEFFGQGCP